MMNSQSSSNRPGTFLRSAMLLATLVGSWLVSAAALAAPLAVKLVGVAPDGTQTDITATANFRWSVEEDATKASIPGQAATTANYSLSFHTSYMPVLRTGRRCAGSLCPPPAGLTSDPDVARVYNASYPDLDTAKRYFVSVAAEGYQMGAAPVEFNGSGANATVYLNKYPLPTAQISVFVFNDNNPINGAPDLPQEDGLAGFTVQLLEAGGTYGASGGAVTQDAFGNPLGTTYKANGDVDVVGNGIILTDANGVALIRNLYPAKYTIFVAPPTGSDWQQTSTIEGTKGIDAWVKNNEPSFFQEFGPPGHHAFIGFTRSGKLAGNNAQGNPCQIGSANCTPVLAPSVSTVISGRIVNTHHSRPPIYTFYNRAPMAECWVGLNEPNGGRALYAARCNKDSTFSIPNVPAGTYELVIWDEPKDVIISATTITVGSASVNLGDFPVSSWFARYQGRVFQDVDGTGLPFFHKPFSKPYIEVDPVTGIEREVVKTYAAGDLKPPFGEGVANNIRFRDGSIYQSTTTKKDGTFAFTEVFPFFNWMIAEIDYARFKATSATVVVDGGGCVKINPGDCAGAPNAAEPVNKDKLWSALPGMFGSNDPALTYDPWIRLNPQLQEVCSAADVASNTDADGNVIDYTKCFKPGAKYYRTEQGVILLEGMQAFLGQTNHVEWGKSAYGIDENGGIAGVISYAITRAEDDPRYATAENWEPGVPRVQVNLFIDCDADGKPDKPMNDGSGLCVAGSLSKTDNYAYDPPDVDNHPFCWRDPESCGLSAPQMGPEDEKRSRTGSATDFSYGDVFRWGAPGQTADNQLHRGLGKTDSWDDSIPEGCPDPTPYVVPFSNPPKTLDCFDGQRNFNQLRPAVFDGGYAFGRVAGQAELPMLIGASGDGKYIVEAVAPPGYLHQGNGDKNVSFGDELKASPAALPFECVGRELDVPEYLTLFPGQLNPNFGSPQYPGNKWRKCDMKALSLLPGTNPAPNFFLFTEAPVAGHGVGFILDDTSAEFNYLAPNFGEKYSPPHLPVSVQDWTGREIARVYSDQFGSYNFLVPSTFTINPPYPSGVMPSMMVACMNHPGPITRDPATGALYDTPRIDPYFNRSYSQFCYTLQYLPGKTTYLDTPVVPVAAFAAVDKNPLDCECADGTPTIYSATRTGTDEGPWVPATGNRQLTIVSVGQTDILNPEFDPAIDPATNPGDARTQRTIKRDYGFGATPGTATLGNTVLTIDSWSDGLITATVPAGAATGQLTIRRSNGKQSVVGLTVHVGGNAPKKVNLAGAGGAFKTIQAAIDAITTADQTSGNNLITVAPGTYKEYVIVDKRVRLQGWGAGSTLIDAAKSATGTLADWRAKVNARANVTFDLLAGQTTGINAPNNEPLLFGAEEGPGILVVGKRVNNLQECLNRSAPLRVDGLTITGSDAGGGILASSYACDIQISNNRVVSNYGTYGGGVRIGHTALAVTTVNNNGTETITYTDAVNRSPNIHHNWITQNGATDQGGGGGVTLGTGSNQYTVSDNYVCGNFSMADGGGLSHLGNSPGMLLPLLDQVGTSNVILRNTFVFNQTFNQAADPMGGGVSIASQVPQGGANYEGTGDVLVEGNLIQGNQAGAGSGGGVSIVGARSGFLNFSIFSDNVWLRNNTIINNIAGYTGAGVSLTGIGGGVLLVNNTIASNVSTATNRQALGTNTVAQGSLPQVAGVSILDGNSPTLLNNIIWGNRSYVYRIGGTGVTLVDPPAPLYRDLGRVSGAGGAPVARNGLFTTGATGFTGTNNVFVASSSGASLFVKPDNFLSIIDPTQPLALQDATVALTPALTFDETGNFVNVIATPLTLWQMSRETNPGTLRADYHLVAGAAAVNAGANRTTGLTPNHVPTNDVDGDARAATNVDIGSDELVLPAANLAITKTDGLSSVNPGQAVTYTIVVSNAGPNPVTAAPVTDTFPASLSVTGWSCTATAGSSCTAGGSGNARTGTVTLLNGGSATYTATATVSVTAAGNVVNTATVAAPPTLSDPDTGNNTATDTDTVIVPMPTLTVIDNFNRANANTLGGNWQQLVTLSNAGVRVNSNQASCSGLLCALGANAYWNQGNVAFGSKQAAAFTFANTTMNDTSLYLKASGSLTLGTYASAVRVRYASGQVVVATTINGVTYTTAATFAGSFINGDTLTAMVDATGQTSVWKTSGATTTLLGSAPTTFTGTGRIGLFLPNGGRVDNFAGGTVP